MWSSSRVSEEEQTESSSFSTSLFNFSSGNPRIEETRGLMHVFPEQTPHSLPVGRKPLVCVVGVPNHMTYADFCQFCGSFIQHILEMRIVRMESMEDRYSVLIRFDQQDSTDAFYTHYNGRRFSSLEISNYAPIETVMSLIYEPILQDIWHVRHCEELMVIVAENNADPKGTNLEISFPCVISMILLELPKLKCF